ncbi:MAG TPA: CPBP family intramembrane glutamic endopeptidase, partial [Gemmatimonadaceae bacterium]
MIDDVHEQPTNGRLLRILHYPATHLLIAIVWVGGWFAALIALKIKPPLLTEAIGAVVVTIAYVVYVRVVERRRVTELAPEAAPREFGAGFLLGAALFTTTIGIIWALGDYAVIGVNPWTAILVPLAFGIAAGVLEEVLFRGVIFRITEEWIGSWGALAFSSLLFGAGHLANPHATLTSALAIALEAGLLLGAAFMITRRLWLPIGLHAAWNFTQSGIFGAPVSGTVAHGLFVSRLSGPNWATGGGFGPEASLPAVLVSLVSIGLLVYAVRSGRVVQPIWRRRARDTHS